MLTSGASLHDDLNLARSAANLLWWTGYWRRNEIVVSVDCGWVTLSGAVDWDYQKRLAVHVLKDLPGLAGIVDDISITFDAPLAHDATRSESGQTDNPVTFSRWS